jgi:hypothetical protein
MKNVAFPIFEGGFFDVILQASKQQGTRTSYGL